MHFMNNMVKVAVALLFSVTAPMAMAYDDCVKPKIKEYNQDEIHCEGELFYVYGGDNGAMVLDKKGKAILPAGRYDYAFQATDGLIGVGDTINGEVRVGFISQATGNEVIPLTYISTGEFETGVNSFSEGLVVMQTPNERWGYLNKQGEIIIPFNYRYAADFSEGFAMVGKGDSDNTKYGFIDKSGKTVIPFAYDGASEFSEGLATVMKDDYYTSKYGVIDKTGNIVVPFIYDNHIAPFSEGLAAIVTHNEELGFIDRSGKLVIPYNYTVELGDGSPPAFKNGKVEIIDTQGNYHCINKQVKKVAC